MSQFSEQSSDCSDAESEAPCPQFGDGCTVDDDVQRNLASPFARALLELPSDPPKGPSQACAENGECVYDDALADNFSESSDDVAAVQDVGSPTTYKFTAFAAPSRPERRIATPMRNRQVPRVEDCCLGLLDEELRVPTRAGRDPFTIDLLDQILGVDTSPSPARAAAAVVNPLRPSRDTESCQYWTKYHRDILLPLRAECGEPVRPLRLFSACTGANSEEEALEVPAEG
jgi:hypothetical protein